MRIVFLGSGDIGLPALEWLADSREHELLAVVTQPDKPAGRKQELLAPPAKQFAVSRDVPVLQPKRMRAPEEIADLEKFKADVFVVMAYGQILPGAVLDVPHVACINLHASLLPRHRGAAPVQAAIEAGDEESGITVMYVGEGLDTGDILLKKTLLLSPDETGGSLHDRLAALAPGALCEALGLLEAGTAPRIPQDDALATYAGKLERGDGLIDWTAPAAAVGRRVRAMNPWPAAWTTAVLDGRRLKLKVWSADVLDETGDAPGAVLRCDAGGIVIGAGEGSVRLKEIQLEGRRRMEVADFLNGHDLPVGARLGEIS
jgi:methionyl-tRNA formyltransferase